MSSNSKNSEDKDHDWNDSRSQIQKLFNQNEAYLSLIIVAYSILVTSLNPLLSFENLLIWEKVQVHLAIEFLWFSSLWH